MEVRDGRRGWGVIGMNRMLKFIYSSKEDLIVKVKQLKLKLTENETEYKRKVSITNSHLF